MLLRSNAVAWLAPLALMALIYVLSDQPDLSSGLGTFDLILRKIAHTLEYALLCFLWWRALATAQPHGRALALAVVITVAYAATDEYHQTFVEGRHGSAVDVLIDACGALAAAALVHRRRPARVAA